VLRGVAEAVPDDIFERPHERTAVVASYASVDLSGAISVLVHDLVLREVLIQDRFRAHEHERSKRDFAVSGKASAVNGLDAREATDLGAPFAALMLLGVVGPERAESSAPGRK
jgi:hypothetical protein